MANEFRIKNGLISTGAATISGSVTATGNITAPQLIGTASRATTASFAVSASWAPGGGSTFPYTGSAGVSGSVVIDGKLIQGAGLTANGLRAHAEGDRNNASGSYSHAEGLFSTTYGDYSHAEGWFNTTNGFAAHAEGGGSQATGDYSHVEGYSNITYGERSHAEGYYNRTYGASSHAEGRENFTYADYSHVEGWNNATVSDYQHVQGLYNLPVSGAGAFIIGNGYDRIFPLTAIRKNLVYASGSTFQISGSTEISGSLYVNGTQITSGGGSAFPYTGSAGISGSLRVSGSIASTGSVNIRGFVNIGANTISSGSNSFTQGASNRANGLNSAALGQDHTVTGQSAAAHGGFNTARGVYSHAEGASNVADGQASHAEGSGTNAVGEASHTEGGTTFANGIGSHAEGDQSIANGSYSHAEGFLTEANGDYSNSQGETTYANGYASHTEGVLTTAVGNYSHAEGASTEALGAASHAEGAGTKTVSDYQHTQGIYNLPISGAGAFIIGNGNTFTQARSNLLYASGSSFQITGSTTISGSLYVNGTQITGGGGSAFPYTGSAAITGSLRVTGSINTNLNADALGFVQDVSQSYSLGKQWISDAYRIIDASGSIVHTRAYGSADSRIGITRGLLSIPDFGAFGRFPSEIAGMTTQFGGDFAAISTQYNQTSTPGTLVNLSNIDNENFQTQIVMTNADTNPSMEMKIYDTAAKSHQISISKNFPGWVISNNMTNPTMSLFRISNSASNVVFEVTQDQKVKVNGTEITAGGGSAFPYTGSAEITGSLSVNNILLAGRAENLLLGEKSVYGVTPYISASGAGNIAIGQTSLPFAISTGTNNIGIGGNAGNSIVLGQDNITIGFQAGESQVSGSHNIAIGETALQSANNTSYNIAIGYNAGAQASLSDRTIMIGAEAGNSADIGDDCVYIGYNALPNASVAGNEIVIGANAMGGGADSVTLGDGNVINFYCAAGTLNAPSDARDKTNIQLLTAGLDFINQIQPVSFEWQKRDGAPNYQGKKAAGFIAQNLLAAQTGSAVGDYLDLVDTKNPDQLQARYGNLIPVLVKAVQELSAEVAALRAQINP